MRAMSHPDYKRQPWSAERRAAASARAMQNYQTQVAKKPSAASSSKILALRLAAEIELAEILCRAERLENEIAEFDVCVKVCERYGWPVP